MTQKLFNMTGAWNFNGYKEKADQAQKSDQVNRDVIL